MEDVFVGDKQASLLLPITNEFRKNFILAAHIDEKIKNATVIKTFYSRNLFHIVIS
jgi:hypothetical protein